MPPATATTSPEPMAPAVAPIRPTPVKPASSSNGATSPSASAAVVNGTTTTNANGNGVAAPATTTSSSSTSTSAPTSATATPSTSTAPSTVPSPVPINKPAVVPNPASFPMMMAANGFYDFTGLDVHAAAALAGYSQLPLGGAGYPAMSSLYAPLKAPGFNFPMAALGNNNRRVVNSAEKRANHNAIERARRDSLNNRFQEIADCIPQLKELKKPSKSVIMQKTLEYVKISQHRFERQQSEIDKLRKENERLRSEIASLRGLPPPIPSSDVGERSVSEDAEGFNLAHVKIDLEAMKSSADSMFTDSDAGMYFHSTDEDMNASNTMSVKQESVYDGQSVSPSSMIHLRQSSGADPLDDLLDDDLRDDPPLSEVSDSFDFDVVKERVEVELSSRHDKDWLLSHGIMKVGADGNMPVSAPLQATSQRMEFKIKQRSLNQQLSSRPSVEDLIGLHIMEH